MLPLFLVLCLRNYYSQKIELKIILQESILVNKYFFDYNLILTKQKRSVEYQNFISFITLSLYKYSFIISIIVRFLSFQLCDSFFWKQYYLTSYWKKIASQTEKDRFQLGFGTKALRRRFFTDLVDLVEIDFIIPENDLKNYFRANLTSLSVILMPM